MVRLYDLTKPYADRLGVDPYLALGGPAEELDTNRRMDPIGQPLSFFGDPILDWKAQYYPWDSKYTIRQDMEDAKSADQSHGVSPPNKLLHPVLADLGPANFKLAHATELLRSYNERFPDSDPLQLKKKYNFDYKALGSDLADWDNLETTAKFAVLDAADAIAFFQRHAPRTWANADKFKKLGLVSTYYNHGGEKMVQDAHEDRSLGGYEPVPSFGGEWSTENGPALSEMIDAQHRTKSEMDFAQRRAKSVSSALPFGKFAYDRAGHPTAYETNASDALSEEGSLPRSFRPPFALADAIQANRPGQYLSGFDFTGGYAPVATPRYSGARYSGGMNDVGTNWGLDAPSERLANARMNAGAGIDPTMTRSIAPGETGFGMTRAPAVRSSDSVAAYALLLRSMLGGLGSARPSPGLQSGAASGSGSGMDTVAVTRMIRQMQQAGASADEIRQMIAENRRRGSATRAPRR
jgi:hypothetical protein